MLDSFTIKIKQLKKLPDVVVNDYPEVYGENQNIITLVTFEITGTKDGLSKTVIKEFHPRFNAETFTNFNELKETDIIGWFEESTFDDIRTDIENDLDKDIINNSITMQLPWQQV